MQISEDPGNKVGRYMLSANSFESWEKKRIKYDLAENKEVQFSNYINLFGYKNT